MACIALRARLSSTCSTIVRSHSTIGRPGSSAMRMRTDSLRACRLTSGMTASSSVRRWCLARLFAPAHEVVHALDHLPGALRLLGNVLQRLQVIRPVPASAGRALSCSMLIDPVA
jgi:hypothetical protein